MLTLLPPPPPPPGPLARQVRDYLKQAKAANTRRAYAADWRHFASWCDSRGLPPLPASAETVALYLSALGDTHKVSSIQRRVSAIGQAHQVAGFDSPARNVLVRNLLAGIRRAKGTAPVTKRPVLTEDLRRMVAALPDNLLGLRDRAVLLIGFAGAFRRSELVALDCADLEFTDQGLIVNIRRSKTDPEGQGRKIGIPYGSREKTCPVRHLERWLAAAGVSEGGVFRAVNRHGQLRGVRLSDKAVALIVKRAAENAGGLEPERLAGHSLRAGLATSAAAAGASERAIMNQTGHRSLTMLRRYIREGEVFRENAAGKIGL